MSRFVPVSELHRGQHYRFNGRLFLVGSITFMGWFANCARWLTGNHPMFAIAAWPMVQGKPTGNTVHQHFHGNSLVQVEAT
jgi:hypothetical protein